MLILERLKLYYELLVEIYGKKWFIFLFILLVTILWPLWYYKKLIVFDPASFTAEWIKFGASVMLYTIIIKYIVTVRDKKREVSYFLHIIRDELKKNVNILIKQLNYFLICIKLKNNENLAMSKEQLFFAWQKYFDSWKYIESLIKQRKTLNSSDKNIINSLKKILLNIDFKYFENCIKTFISHYDFESALENDLNNFIKSLIDQDNEIDVIIQYIHKRK